MVEINQRQDYRSAIYGAYMTVGYGDLNRRSFNTAIPGLKANFGPLLPVNRSASVLEIGCGMGHFQAFLQAEGFNNRIAIDIGAEQIKFCQQHLEGDFRLVNDTFEFLHGQMRSYGLVVMNDLIEHFTKAELVELLRLVRESLCDGGAVIMRTPNMANPHAAVSRYGDFTHEIGLEERSAKQLLSSLGFSEVFCYSEEPYLRHSVKRLIYALLRRWYQSVIRFKWWLDRPGDHHPRILSKNLIIRAVR